MCDNVGSSPKNILQQSMVSNRGLNMSLYKHQLIAGFWTAYQEREECEGVWLADDMGLGKVPTYLRTPMLNFGPSSG